MTNGHIDLIVRASNLFDEVIVSVATNMSKFYLFNPSERVQLVKEAVCSLSNVQVVSQPEGLTVEVAQKLETQFLIRGIRSVKDYEYERDVALMNRSLMPGIETVLLFAEANNMGISSSIVKEIARFGGDIQQFVPENIALAISQKQKEGEL